MAAQQLMSNPTKRNLILALVALSTSLGCGGASTPAKSTTNANPTTTTPRSQAATGSTASPASASPASPTPASPLAQDLGPSPFQVTGEHDTPLALFPVGKVAFLRVDGRLLTIRDGHVTYDRAPNRGLPTGSAYDQVVIAGSWPDNALVLASRRDKNRQRTEMFFWDGHRWKSKFQTPKSTQLRSLGPWNLRRVLAFGNHVDSGKPWFRVVAGFPLDPVPRPSQSEIPGCDTQVRLERAAFLRSGHVFAAGSLCGEGTTPLAVERWEPDKNTGQVDTLPDSDGVDIRDVVAKSPSSVWVAGASESADRPAFLARFNGESWEREQVPMRSGIEQLTSGGDDMMWIVTRAGKLWKQDKAGVWTQVPLPNEPDGAAKIEALTVWPVATGDTWVVGKYETAAGKVRHVLLHTGKHDGPIPFDRVAD